MQSAPRSHGSGRQRELVLRNMARLKIITLICSSPGWKWQVAESITQCYKGGINSVGLWLQCLWKQRVHQISPYLIFRHFSSPELEVILIHLLAQNPKTLISALKNDDQGAMFEEPWMRLHERGLHGSLLLTNTAPKWISSIYRMQQLAIYITTNLTFHNGDRS